MLHISGVQVSPSIGVRGGQGTAAYLLKSRAFSCLGFVSFSFIHLNFPGEHAHGLPGQIDIPPKEFEARTRMSPSARASKNSKLNQLRVDEIE